MSPSVAVHLWGTTLPVPHVSDRTSSDIQSWVCTPYIHYWILWIAIRPDIYRRLMIRVRGIGKNAWSGFPFRGTKWGFMGENVIIITLFLDVEVRPAWLSSSFFLPLPFTHTPTIIPLLTLILILFLYYFFSGRCSGARRGGSRAQYCHWVSLRGWAKGIFIPLKEIRHSIRNRHGFPRLVPGDAIYFDGL